MHLIEHLATFQTLIALIAYKRKVCRNGFVNQSCVQTADTVRSRKNPGLAGLPLRQDFEFAHSSQNLNVTQRIFSL